MSRSVIVRTTASTTLPGDEPLLVAPGDPTGIVVESFGTGRHVVHGADGVETEARTGRIRRLPSGIVELEVIVDGWRFTLEVEDGRRAELRRRATRTPDAAAASGPTDIRAIIPGRIAAIRVGQGDVVEAGQSLLVVEAMKMQTELRAPRAGTIERVAVHDGDTVDNGDLLVVLR
ncbi:MAG: biotin/lipoyl-containing protein [Candidatus Limnocylindrales bacterium]